MTRDPDSRRAKDLAALPGVELFKGSFANEEDLINGFDGCDGAVSSTYPMPYSDLLSGLLIRSE